MKSNQVVYSYELLLNPNKNFFGEDLFHKKKFETTKILAKYIETVQNFRGGTCSRRF